MPNTTKKKIIKLETVATKKSKSYKKRKETAKTKLKKQKKRKRSLMETSLLKKSISFQEFVLIRNVKEMRLEEEAEKSEAKEPKQYCQTCKMYRDGRCTHPNINRPVKATNRCFKHSAYPQKEELYLVEKNIEIDTTLVAINTDELEKHAS